MSKPKDTHEASLEAVLAALDALCVTKHAQATAHQPEDDGYSQWHHTMACGEANGVTQAYWLVEKMLTDYRKLANVVPIWQPSDAIDTANDFHASLDDAEVGAWTTDRGTNYRPGSTPEAADWKPTDQCGHGLHFCTSPTLSRWHLPSEDHATARYLVCGIRLDEMVVLGDKCKARRVVVACVEVDEFGDEVTR